jgi:hypothetical protein
MCGEILVSVASKDCSKGNCSPTTESSRRPDQLDSNALKRTTLMFRVIIWRDKVG